MTSTLTAHGVCYDIRNSPFTHERHGLNFFFSSYTHMAKFRREVQKREEWLQDSLTRRFKCTMAIPEVAAIQLYTKIESRGFYITTADGAEYTRPESICIMVDTRVIGVSDA